MQKILFVFVLLGLLVSACGGNNSSASGEEVPQAVVVQQQVGYDRPDDVCRVDGYAVKNLCVKIVTYKNQLGGSRVYFWTDNPDQLKSVSITVGNETKEIAYAQFQDFSSFVDFQQDIDVVSLNCEINGAYNSPEDIDLGNRTFVYDCK